MPPKIDRIQEIYSKAGINRTVTLVYDGQTKTGLSGGVKKENFFQIQGYQEQYLFSIWIKSGLFTTEPVATKAITVDGNERRILNVIPDGVNALIRLDLGGRYGGI